MARIGKHLRLAERNLSTLNCLLEKVEDHPEWVATVAFYRALQIAEAVLVHRTGDGSSEDGDRHRRLKTDKYCSQIWRHYRMLLSASRVARCLADSEGSSFESFASYMSPEKTRSVLVNDKLKQVEKSAKKLLGKHGKDLVS